MHDKFHDSAGVPWEGREFSQNSWSNDDGTTPAVLEKVFELPLDKAELFKALAQSRLLIPLLAELGESGVGAHGQTVDKSADLAIVAVGTPDGKSAIPAFSSVAEMSNWNATARPVPVEVPKLAIAAVSEGHDRVVLNPAGRAIVIRRPALAALAQGLQWVPPHLSEVVAGLVQAAAARHPAIKSVGLFDSDPTGQLLKAELGIQVSLEAGLPAQQLQELLSDFSSELQTQEFLQQVDSVTFRLVAS